MQDVLLKNSDIQNALEKNSEYFIQFFLGEEIVEGVPDFHIELFDMMTIPSIVKLCLAVPRAHSKTELARLAAVYYLQFTDYAYVLYVSSTLKISKPSVEVIFEYFQSENYTSVFGPITVTKEQHGLGEYQFRLANGKHCILKAFSAGQSVRGTNIKKRRPQIIIPDDMEDGDDNIATTELFMKLKRWFYGSFKKCIDPKKHKWIWIGNLTKDKSMLQENLTDPSWHSRLYGCLLDNAEPLWPWMWPLEALRADYLDYQRNGMIDIWFAEMMNMPIAVGNGVIDADEIKYAAAIEPEDYPSGFLTMDLAISKEKWGHKSVIAVHIWNVDGEFWQISECCSYHGADPIELFKEVVRLGLKWRIGIVGIESVAYQASLQSVFEHLAVVYKVRGFTFKLVPARAQKPIRIITWAKMIKAGEYRLTEGDFVITQKLLKYDPKSKDNDDDELDACAHGNYMIRMFLTEIFSSTSMEEALGLSSTLTIIDTYSVSAV